MLFQLYFTLCILMVITSDFVRSDCPAAKQWKKQKLCTDKTLPRTDAYTSFSVDHKLKCLKSCNTTDCLSVSYDSTTRTCYHFDTIGDVCNTTVLETDTVYYYKDIQCLNGGTPTPSWTTTRCDCPVGVFGWNCRTLATGCQDLHDRGVTGRARRRVQFSPNLSPVHVQCDGHYTIMLLHYTRSLFNLNRTWDEYVNGFSMDDSQLWIGLEPLHQLTKYSLRQGLYIAVTSTHGSMDYDHWARYKGFKVDDESTYYMMTFSSYGNPAENSLGDVLRELNGSSFSTPDNDHDGNDEINCALDYAAGWWFDGQNNCARNSPTSPFTCTGDACGPQSTKQFPDRQPWLDSLLYVQMWLYTL